MSLHSSEKPRPTDPFHRLPLAHRRLWLWIDSVGTFLICPGERVRIGGPDLTAAGAEISLLANLSRMHATLGRCGEAYFVEAHGPTEVDGCRVDARATLNHGSTLSLGNNVQLRFQLPSPLSRTARLEFASAHGLARSVDGIVLMDETCLLGSTSENHIKCSSWTDSVLLYRRGDELWCRSRQEIEIDGRPVSGGGVLHVGSVVTGSDFRFRIEAPGIETP